MAAKTEFLGNTLQEYAQNIRNGYARAYILFALHETGVLKALKDGPPKTCEELAAECNIEPYILNGALHYLLFCDRILERTNGRYNLTEFGREVLFADTLMTFCWGAVGGYSIILTELIPALRRQKKYGVDFTRRGDYLAVGSQLTGRGSYSWILQKLRDLKARRLVDVGCGSAAVLTAFCQMDSELKGVGLDIDPGFQTEARRRVEAMGLTDRIQLVLGDITKPAQYIDVMGKVDAFNAMMVMHEFLRDGEDAVAEILRVLKKAFPGKYMIITEAIPATEEEFNAMAWEDRPYLAFSQYVIHPFTWQGIPQLPEVWFRIFDKAKVTLEQFQGGHSFSANAKNQTQYSSRLAHYVLKF
jgi:SAM-dependent methyltransferase